MPQSSTNARAQEQEFKRARGAISCAECRRLKLKCDKTVPCSSCKRRGCASICPNGSLTTGQGTRFILADTDRLHRKIGEMSDRIRHLEDALAILQSSTTRESHPLLANDLLKIKSSLELHSASRAAAFDEMDDPQKGEEPDEYIDAFGTLAVRDDGGSMFYGRSAGSESLLLGEEAQPMRALTRKPSQVVLDESLQHLTASFPAAPSTVDVADAEDMIRRFLPPWPRAVQLCDLYLEQAPWFFGAVTRRQLVEEVLPAFYPDAAPAAPSIALASAAEAFQLRDGQKAPQCGAHDLALLFVIFCFGALTDESLSPAPNNPEADRYFQLCRAAMNLEPVLERPPSVVTVQTLSLMGIYQGLVADENSIEGTWALMGLSSKLAQSIGLHRDSARWKLTPAEVQKRRAFFWELFITDCWQSLATGRLPTFSLQFVDTELAPDSEETLADDGTSIPSFPAWKARFGKECVADVVQGTLTSRAPKYTLILELDRKIRDMPLPKYATDPAPAKAGLRETMLHYMPLNYRDLTLLYVHRCFFAQALIDYPTDPLKSQYAPSFGAGYRSACELLANLREAFALYPIQIARFWVLWTHAFSSAVMLASVVTRGGITKTAQAAMGELRLAHDLFENAAKHGGRSIQFRPIVQRLYDKAVDMYQKGAYPLRKDIFSRRDVKEEQQDELSIFSGRTPRTVTTKTSKKIAPARSVSRHPHPTSSQGTSPEMQVSPPITAGSHSNGSSARDSASPQSTAAESLPALDSYGASVHQLLADQMRSFSGELDHQISSHQAYYANQQHAYMQGQEHAQQQESVFAYQHPEANVQEQARQQSWYQSPPQQDVQMATRPAQSQPQYASPPDAQYHSQNLGHVDHPQAQQYPVPSHHTSPGHAQQYPSQSQYAAAQMQQYSTEPLQPQHTAQAQAHAQHYAMQQQHQQRQAVSQQAYPAPHAGYHQDVYQSHQASPIDQPYVPTYAQALEQRTWDHTPQDLAYPDTPAEYVRYQEPAVHQGSMQHRPSHGPPSTQHQQPPHYHVHIHHESPPPSSQGVYPQQQYITPQHTGHGQARQSAVQPQYQMMPPPPQHAMPVQPEYSLQETWTSFMQQELPIPAGAPQSSGGFARR